MPSLGASLFCNFMYKNSLVLMIFNIFSVTIFKQNRKGEHGFMYFQEIVKKLAENKTLEFGHGEYIIDKKLREVVGGIPIYDIQVQSLLNDDDVKKFKTLDEFDYLYLSDMENKDLKRCHKCGEIKHNDYYVNYENGMVYCGIGCLIDGMNSLYGEGEWKLAFNALKNTDLSKGFILIKENATGDYSVVIDGENWRYLDLQWVHYDFKGDNDFIDVSMEDVFTDNKIGF